MLFTDRCIKKGAKQDIQHGQNMSAAQLASICLFLVLEFDTYLRCFLLLTHNSPFRRRYVSNYIWGSLVEVLIR